VSTDTRKLEAGQVFFALEGEQYEGDIFVSDAFAQGAVAAVTTKANAAGPCILVDDAVQALQAFAAHHRRQHPIPLFAVTGSCGKTTAKEFTAALLSTKYTTIQTPGNFNNEIGCPLSLLQLQGDTERAVIEIGANHAGEIARLCALARPTESAVTMVGAAHLEGFGSVEKVAAAKEEIVGGLGERGRFYVNVDDPWCAAMGARFEGEKVYFGSSGDVVLEDCTFSEDGDMVLTVAPVGSLRLPLAVKAQATNVLLSVAVALQHGVDVFEEPLRSACQNLSRCIIEHIGPLEVLNDSYNANPASVSAALEALALRPGQGARIAVLGEMLELGEHARVLHEEVGAMAGAQGVTHLFARGPHAKNMVEAAHSSGVAHAVALEEYDAIAHAVSACARPGDVLLVKGSRGMRMELVLEELKKGYGASNDGQDPSQSS
jgi:UDP-N-acetylmuramoyl-tripeptide--D-alanyl-D-alanine ligase